MTVGEIVGEAAVNPGPVGNRCAVGGCRKRSDDHHLCPMHRSRLRRYGSVNADRAPRAAADITPEDIAEIKRRRRNIESINAIARATGLPVSAIRTVIKGEIK